MKGDLTGNLHCTFGRVLPRVYNIILIYYKYIKIISTNQQHSILDLMKGELTFNLHCTFGRVLARVYNIILIYYKYIKNIKNFQLE